MHTRPLTVLSLATLVAVAAMLMPLGAAQAAETCMDAPVAQLAASGINGNARLCTSTSGTHADMSAEKMTSGNAYTIWFVYFDDPTTCATQPCTGADALGDDPVASFGRMDGVVADGSGAARFSGDFRDLRLSQGSEVWLLMFGHGAANTEDNRARARQLLTPQSPKLGAPGLGAVADGEIGTGVARAVFTLP